MDVGEHLTNDVGDALLVLRCEEAVEKADGDGLNALRAKCPNDLSRLILVQRDFDLTRVADSLSDFVAKLTRYKGNRLICLRVIHMRTPASAELKKVFEPAGRNESCPDTTMGKQGIGAHCRSVSEVPDVANASITDLIEKFCDTGENRPPWVVGSARYLANMHLTSRLVERADVGKGSACVHPDS
ncbi:hypothetical protein GCM10027267_31090 [Paramicrobacterium agarici]